jgi:hypothetical protein
MPRTIITISVTKGESFTLRDLRTLVEDAAAGLSDECRVTLAAPGSGAAIPSAWEITLDSAKGA